RLYEFMTQIISYEDEELEKLCIYARHLLPLIREENLEEEGIDLEGLELTHYRVTKQKEQSLQLAEGRELDPHTGVGSASPKDEKKERLDEIIEILNEIYGTGIEDRDQLNFAYQVCDRMIDDDEVVEQIKRHTTEQVMHGLYPQRLNQVLITSLQDHEEMTLSAMSSEESM